MRYLKRRLLVWAIYRAIVTVTAYSAGWTAGYLIAAATGDIERATSIGTLIGVVSALIIDWIVFNRTILYLHQSMHDTADDESDEEAPPRLSLAPGQRGITKFTV